jgi:ribosome-associated protein
MTRKLKKGYYVKGQFVAEGSELDLELKRELRGDTDVSKTDLKRESAELQKLGEDLLTLRADLMARLDLPEKLVDALAEARRITNFEGRRRQMQFIGKLMRLLDPQVRDDARAALAEQHAPSARETELLHTAEQWRERLIADDDAVAQWISSFPGTDTQQLRALVRQARKDALPPDRAAVSQGLAPRQGRAYRELFQMVREQLTNSADTENDHE